MAKLMLVADANWVVNAVQASLVDQETTLAVVSDPRAVVETAISDTPDAVIVDLQVGSMGGMAICRALRDTIDMGEIPVAGILLLLDRSADEFLARRAGADAWLVKPFTPQQLRIALGSVMKTETSPA